MLQVLEDWLFPAPAPAKPKGRKPMQPVDGNRKSARPVAVKAKRLVTDPPALSTPVRPKACIQVATPGTRTVTASARKDDAAHAALLAQLRSGDVVAAAVAAAAAAAAANAPKPVSTRQMKQLQEEVGRIAQSSKAALALRAALGARLQRVRYLE